MVSVSQETCLAYEMSFRARLNIRQPGANGALPDLAKRRLVGYRRQFFVYVKSLCSDARTYIVWMYHALASIYHLHDEWRICPAS